MNNVDTPDHQYSAVSAQRLLATIPAGTTTIDVDLPINLETLVLVAQVVDYPTYITVTGKTTGVQYAGVALPPLDSGSSWSQFLYDVSSAVDATVTITFASATVADIYAYSDAGVHLIADPNLAAALSFTGDNARPNTLQIGGTDGTYLRALRTDASGQLQAVQTIPGTTAEDHPVTEILSESDTPAHDRDVISAPGAGKRLRVFAMQMSSTGAGTRGVLTEGSGGGLLCACDIAGYGSVNLPDQGYALPENTSVYYNVITGTDGMHISIYYTIETI